MESNDRRMLDMAIETAVFMHANQADKNGKPYILHPLRVMLAVRELGGSVIQQAAAVLHDVSTLVGSALVHAAIEPPRTRFRRCAELAETCADTGSVKDRPSA